MIFLAAAEPNVSVTVYGKSFLLEPLTFPEINPTQILVMEDELGRRILKQNSKKVQRIRFESARLPGFPKPFSNDSHIPQNSRLILLRGGGIGDVLMCTPAIREMRKRLPNIRHLTLSTFKSNESLFIGNPNIDAVVAQPLTLSEFMKADYYFEFRDPTSLMSRLHMIDFYLLQLGFKPATVSSRCPILPAGSLFDRDISGLLKAYRKDYTKIIYLSGLASDKLRDLPTDTLFLLPRQFPEMLFLLPADYCNRYPDSRLEAHGLSNIHWLNTENSLPGYVTAVNECDAVVTTDSSAYHIAAALGKRCLALFGPIAPELRASYYPTVHALEAGYQGETCRSPCGKSMISEFYGGAVDGKQICPEADLKKSRFSPCLGNFSKKNLIDALKRILGPDQ